MRLGFALTVMLAMVTSAACQRPRILCEKPLVLPENAWRDSRLPGIYVFDKDLRENNPRSRLVLISLRWEQERARESSSEAGGIPQTQTLRASGTLDVLVVGGDERLPGLTRCDAFASRIGSRTYLNARCPGFKDMKDQAIVASDRYDILRYDFGPDGVLAIRWMSPAAVSVAIEGEELSGSVKLVSSASSDLAAFVAKSDDAFVREGMLLRRVSMAKAPAAPQPPMPPTEE
jgi:hypothetical protein